MAQSINAFPGRTHEDLSLDLQCFCKGGYDGTGREGGRQTQRQAGRSSGFSG